MNERILSILAILGIMVCGLASGSELDPELDIRIEFQNKYSAWKTSLNNHRNFRTPEFYDLVKMGPSVVPYLIEVLESRPKEAPMGLAIRLITKKSIPREEWPEGRYLDAITYGKLLVKWWNSSRNEVNVKFPQYYGQWKSYQKKSDNEGASLNLQGLKHLGIDALPFLMEKIKDGDHEMIFVVSYLSNREVAEDATPEECLVWWAVNQDRFTLPRSKTNQ